MRAAKAATVHGAWSAPPPTRFERQAPFSRDLLSVVRGAWSQQRVADETATHAVTPTHASTASRQAGLFPETPSATIDLHGTSPAWALPCNMAAASGGVVCQVASAGPGHLARLALASSAHHGSGLQSRLSTSAEPGREA